MHFVPIRIPLIVLLFFASWIGAQDDSVPLENDLELEEEFEEEVLDTEPDPSVLDFWEAIERLELGDQSTYKEGRRLLERSADAEYVHAQYYLGLCYRFGYYGFKKSSRRAVSWFRFAAERGSPYAMSHLGQLYFLGEGTRKNYGEAKKWLSQAVAENADYVIPPPPEGTFDEPVASTSKVESSGNETVAGLEPSTTEENIRAMSHYILGLVYEHNEDFVQAQHHLIKAARAGERGRAGIYGAAVNAAVNYAFGQKGLERDLGEAELMLELSKKLQQRQNISLSHNLVKAKAIDSFALADFQELMDRVSQKRVVNVQRDIAKEFADESSENFNLEEAVKWYELAAENGNTWAHIHLGFIHWNGGLGERDAEKAAYWFEKISDDHILGAGNAGIIYEHGLGVPQDSRRAAELFAKKKNRSIVCYLGTIGKAPPFVLNYEEHAELCEVWAKKGDAQAQYLLGERYQYGYFFKEDQGKANQWYKRAMAQGHADAFFEMGNFYTQVNPTDRNVVRGLDLYIRGSEAGSSSAAYEFASTMYDFNQPFAALPFIQRALELDQDFGKAHNLAAIVYDQLIRGERIPVDGKQENPDRIEKFLKDQGLVLSPSPYTLKDLSEKEFERIKEKLFLHYREADRLELGVAAYNLGLEYYFGKHTQRNFEEAYLLFQTAAERGCAKSNRFLGHMHRKGEGVPVTLQDAAYYYRLAALDGDKESLVQICDFYLKGRGVDRDLTLATFWLGKLADQGDRKSLIMYGDILLEEKRYIEARRWFVNLIERYSWSNLIRGEANHRLSLIYKNGFGVAVNERRAGSYFSKALQYDNLRARVDQAQFHINTKDFEASVPILQKAISEGSLEATFLLGCMYFQGQGVEKNDAEGWKLVKVAADNGHMKAKLSMAIATYQGREKAPGLDEAITYAKEAEAADTPQAAKVRRLLEKKRSSNAKAETAVKEKSS